MLVSIELQVNLCVLHWGFFPNVEQKKHLLCEILFEFNKNITENFLNNKQIYEENCFKSQNYKGHPSNLENLLR